MPLFLCPCCGESYLVPLAACEFILEQHRREGWEGAIAPAKCLACQLPIAVGDTILLRGGAGVTASGEKLDLPEGIKATVVSISTWEGEGSIYLVRLSTGTEVYTTRGRIAPQKPESREDSPQSEKIPDEGSQITFTGQIPRDVAARYGHEAVAIAARGEYCAPSGRLVDLREAIARAIESTTSYPPNLSPEISIKKVHETSVEVTNETTLSAAVRLLQQGFKPVVLNFASATSPGGGFLGGSRAQEEYLARSSCLYPCIRNNPMYAFHRAAHDPFYTDYVLYSPEVPVIRGDTGDLLESPYNVSIITAAAVHAKKVAADRRGDISPVMWKRILKVLAVGIAHEHDAIVLGAWGCGAFGNDGNEIAASFRRALESDFRGAYRKVVFAIVDWSDNRRFIGPFADAFREPV